MNALDLFVPEQRNIILAHKIIKTLIKNGIADPDRMIEIIQLAREKLKQMKANENTHK